MQENNMKQLVRVPSAALMALIAVFFFTRLQDFQLVRTVVSNLADPQAFSAPVLPGFIRQSPDAPKLRHFQQYTAPLIVRTSDPLAQIILIQHWVRAQQSDKQPYRQPGRRPDRFVDNTEEPEEYLNQQQRGVPGACRRFSFILTGALLSVGINARVVAVTSSLNAPSETHDLVEAWVPALNKWVLLDPTFDAFVLVDGHPASLLEVYRAEVSGSQQHISLDQHGSHYRLPSADYYRGLFQHLFFASTNAIFDGYHYGLFERKRIEFVYFVPPGGAAYPQHLKELMLVGLTLSVASATVLVIWCLAGLLFWLLPILTAYEFDASVVPSLAETEL